MTGGKCVKVQHPSLSHPGITVTTTPKAVAVAGTAAGSVVVAARAVTGVGEGASAGADLSELNDYAWLWITMDLFGFWIGWMERENEMQMNKCKHEFHAILESASVTFCRKGHCFCVKKVCRRDRSDRRRKGDWKDDMAEFIRKSFDWSRLKGGPNGLWIASLVESWVGWFESGITVYYPRLQGLFCLMELLANQSYDIFQHPT